MHSRIATILGCLALGVGTLSVSSCSVEPSLPDQVMSTESTSIRPSRDYRGLPSELHGTWCSRVTKQACIDLADVFLEFPLATFSYGSSYSGPYFFLAIETAGPESSMAETMTFHYFPAGAVWDCVTEARKYEFSSCNPDYTEAHVTSEPRLVHVPNHQMGYQYDDKEPYYLDPTTDGLRTR
ncbi:MAG: hypothetical protein FWG15_04325 [Propionibacteriaceae bacterium]|nr:hypothetical protein [Propionibacteriaceae bacterium]